ncbi:hypothetical protein AAG906_008163 [Vitis piasezkii]
MRGLVLRIVGEDDGFKQYFGKQAESPSAEHLNYLSEVLNDGSNSTLLVYIPGLDFIDALFGCLKAKFLSVPLKAGCRKFVELFEESKKLKSKIIRVEAPSQSIAATRLLEHDGLNAEQLARVSIMDKLAAAFKSAYDGLGLETSGGNRLTYRRFDI